MLGLGDGTCIIELMPTQPGGSDLWAPYDLKGVSFRLIQKCMNMGDDGGGAASRLGRSRSCQYEQNDGDF